MPRSTPTTPARSVASSTRRPLLPPTSCGSSSIVSPEGQPTTFGSTMRTRRPGSPAEPRGAPARTSHSAVRRRRHDVAPANGHSVRVRPVTRTAGLEGRGTEARPAPRQCSSQVPASNSAPEETAAAPDGGASEPVIAVTSAPVADRRRTPRPTVGRNAGRVSPCR